MDLIFQSGEFYNQDSTFASVVKLTLPLVGALVSGGVAIWIFNRGIRKRREEEEAKESKRLDELKDYVLTLLKLLEIPIDKQIANYLKFSNNLKTIDEINYTPAFEVSLNTKNFRSVNRQDLYKIFVTRSEGDTSSKAKFYQELNAQIDYIKVAKQSFEESFKYFATEHKLFVETWQDNINKIGQGKNHMATDANARGMQPGDDPFLDEFTNLFSEWVQANDYKQRHVAVDKFIVPLESICEKYHSDLRATIILTYCVNCLLAFKNIEHLKRFTRKDTVESACRLRNTKKVILDFLDRTARNEEGVEI